MRQVKRIRTPEDEASGLNSTGSRLRRRQGLKGGPDPPPPEEYRRVWNPKRGRWVVILGLIFVVAFGARASLSSQLLVSLGVKDRD